MASDPSSAPANGSRLAERIKQLTAMVAALTAFVAGVTALVVAAKAGWSEVGPYFGNLFRHGDVVIPDKHSVQPATTGSIDPALLSALEAGSRAERSEARRALALAVAKASPRDVDMLIDRLTSSSSYRMQLGIAVVLQEAPGGWPSENPAGASAHLRALRTRTSDQTLRAALDAAAGDARR